jgi:hypothetical protein
MESNGSRRHSLADVVRVLMTTHRLRESECALGLDLPYDAGVVHDVERGLANQTLNVHLRARA